MANTRTTKSAKSASGVFDLNAARARRVEESGEELAFTFGDPAEEFVVPPPMEWALEIPEVIAESNVQDALRLLLGDDQYERFASHKPRVGDMRDLLEWLSTESTGGAGNS